MWHVAPVLAVLLLACAPGAHGQRRSFTFRLEGRGPDGLGPKGGRGLLRNATLPLHGAVKDYGYFYASLYLGTPPKKFAVIVDTGSTMTYVPCATCGSACGPNHQDAAFDPRLSSTANIIPCNGDKCRCGAPRCACSDAQQCMYTRSYAEQSSSSGILLEDMLWLHDGNAGAPVIFGCEMRETGEIFKQRADGLFGLGNSDASLVNQLVTAGHIEDTFSLCFGMVEGDGVLVLGEGPAMQAVPLQYTDLVTSPTHPFYYNVRLTSLSVGGDELDLPANLFDEGYGTVLDSGTTFSYMPTPAFKAFADAVEAYALGRGLVRVKGPDLQYDDICFGGAPDHTDSEAMAKVFPMLGLHFAPDVTLTLGPLNYLFVHTFNSGKFCLGVFDNGRAGTLLGGITFRNVMVKYDRGRRRVGFGAASCKDLGEAHRPPCAAFSAEGNELAAIVAVADGDCQPDAAALHGGVDDDDYEAEDEVIMPQEGQQSPAAAQGRAPGGQGAGQGQAGSGSGSATPGQGSQQPGGGEDVDLEGGSEHDEHMVVGGQEGSGGGGEYEHEQQEEGEEEFAGEVVDRMDGTDAALDAAPGGQESRGMDPVHIALLGGTLAMLAVACVGTLVMRPYFREALRALVPRLKRYRQLEGDDPEQGQPPGGAAGAAGGLHSAPMVIIKALPGGGAVSVVGAANQPDGVAADLDGKSGGLSTSGQSSGGGSSPLKSSGAGAVPPLPLLEMEMPSKAPGGEMRVMGLTTPQKLQRTNSAAAAAAAAALAEELAALRAESVTPRAGAQGLTPRALSQPGASPLGRPSMGTRAPGTPTYMP